jgi:hypothetical protein
VSEIGNFIVRCARRFFRNRPNIMARVSQGADNPHIDAFVGQDPHALRAVAGGWREHDVFPSDDVGRVRLGGSDVLARKVRVGVENVIFCGTLA